MPNLILLTTKHLIESTPEKWLLAILQKAILFTGDESKQYIDENKKIFNNIFCKIVYFENYQNSDLIEKEILSINNQFKINQIIALAEVDILRAARAREWLGIKGQTISSAMMYRNKHEMKHKVESAGLLSPKYCPVNNTIDLLNFINKIGYPVIIKPISGRGSSNTFVIKNEGMLDASLSLGIFNNNDCGSSLLAEKFISGDVYHLDGLIHNNQLKFINASQYINNCLDFLGGSYLGSITLSDSNLLKAQLIKTAKTILFDALETPKNSLFHIELFVDKDKKIYFCEAASRLGGGNINEQLLLSYDYDIKIEFVKSFFNEKIAIPKKQKSIAARLLIPPQANSVLKKIPSDCPFNWVKSYVINGTINKTFLKVTMSNQEIAHFIFESNSESDAMIKMQQLSHWFYAETEWISV